MIDDKVMIIAMPGRGQAPTPELVEQCKLIEHQARFVDELNDAVDELVRAHIREMPEPQRAVIVQRAIDLQRKMAEPA